MKLCHRVEVRLLHEK